MSLFRRFFHACDLRPVAVEHRDNPRPLLPPAPSTLILYRCECSRVESVEVTGAWTLSQVTGTAEEEAGG